MTGTLTFYFATNRQQMLWRTYVPVFFPTKRNFSFCLFSRNTDTRFTSSIGQGQNWRQTQPTVSILTKKISLKATLSLSYISPVRNIWILQSVSYYKHSACNLLEGTMEETDKGGGVCIDFFSHLFRLNASHFPPQPLFVQHLSFPINLHQSLYPCWVKNCTHYLCHVVYRNSILFHWQASGKTT